MYVGYSFMTIHSVVTHDHKGVGLKNTYWSQIEWGVLARIYTMFAIVFPILGMMTKMEYWGKCENIVVYGQVLISHFGKSEVNSKART